jgi:hypothetical protein
MFGYSFFKKKYLHLDKLIDKRNKTLWFDINKNYKVSFKKSSQSEYAVCQQSNKVIFYIDENNLCASSFTHKLLHVFLSLKGLHISGGLKNRIIFDEFFNSIISYNLLEHIGNCLDHIKMLPIYLELGFEREKFITDFDVFKCTETELNELERYYRVSNKINTNAVDEYIVRLVSIIADPNENFDCNKYLIRLKIIDSKLFLTIYNLFDNWKKVKIENRTILDEGYISVLNVFIDELNTWKRTNAFS